MAAVAPSFVIYERIQIPFPPSDRVSLSLSRSPRQSETLTFGLKVTLHILLLHVALVTRYQRGRRYGEVDKMRLCVPE